MIYEEACADFDVKDTKRQRGKWDRDIGRARKLADALSGQIYNRREDNALARAENTAIDVLNASTLVKNEEREALNDGADDLSQLPMLPLVTKIPILDEFTQADVCRVLGQ